MKKYYSPIGKQDFMWFMEDGEGTRLNEYNVDKTSNSFIHADKSNVAIYGLVGLGIQLDVDLTKRVFNLLNNQLRVSLLVDGEDEFQSSNVFLTKPYKHAVDTAVISANEKLKEFYSLNSNIASYEFGYAVLTGKVAAQVTCHLVMGEKLYMQVRAKSVTDTEAANLVFKVNGNVDEFQVDLNNENWSELNWTFKE